MAWRTLKLQACGLKPPDHTDGIPAARTCCAGWTDNTDWATGVSIRYAPESGDACGRGVASCLRISILQGFVQFGQFLSAPAGSTYRLAIQARAQPTSGGGAVSVQLTLRKNGVPPAEYGTVSSLGEAAPNQSGRAVFACVSW